MLMKSSFRDSSSARNPGTSSKGYVQSASPVTIMSPWAFANPALYALPYPRTGWMNTVAPFFRAMCPVLSVEPLSTITISTS